jgi:hypothetical protein
MSSLFLEALDGMEEPATFSQGTHQSGMWIGALM